MSNTTNNEEAPQSAKPRRTASEHLAFVVNELLDAPLYIFKMR